MALTLRRWGGIDRFIRSATWHQRALALLLAWVVLTGLLIAVGVGIVHSSSINAFDRRVTSVVVAHRTPALNEAMKAVTWLGSWVALVATGLLLVFLALRRRLPMTAVVLAVIAWAGESSAVTLAKHVIERARPPQDLWLVPAHGWSFPSGHSAVTLLVFTTVALVVITIAPTSGSRTLTLVVAGVAVAAVAFSRIELGVHWTTDVIASMIFVGAWMVVLFALFGSDIRPKHMDGELH